MMKWRLGLVLILASVSLSQQVKADAHIQSLPWSPDAVFSLTGALGWQLMIEFGPDERIENVSIGDATAWQVTPNKCARNLFLKPLSGKTATNMTVLTDKRRYAFALAVGPRRPSTPWVVRFDYPRPIVEVVDEPLPPPPPILNFTYASSGDALLTPIRVWDDGRQTYFEFAKGQAIPAIFAGKPGKTESLVNSVMNGRVAIVQQMDSHFTLRTGDRMASVSRTAETPQ
jgi:type IV secretion system protein VirB9